MQLGKYRLHSGRIDRIFISHLHGDHCFGLIGLLTSFALSDRDRPLEVYSPPGLREMIEVQLRMTASRLPFVVNFVEVTVGDLEVLVEEEAFEVLAFPLRHRIPTLGYLFRERPAPRRIRPEKIEEYGLDFLQIRAIKSGADLSLPGGSMVPNAELTYPSSPPRSFAYCSDTAFEPRIAEFANGVDLLFHESTFCSDRADRAAETQHATAAQAAQIARLAGAGRLLLGHFSSRYEDATVFLQEAQAIFPRSELTWEGRVVQLPFEKRPF